MFTWFLLIVFIALAISKPWWWIGAALLAFYKVARWYFYDGRPWRRMHYPMMRAYANAAGFETGMANREGREFDIRNALRVLLKSVKPEWSDDDINTRIESEFINCDLFKDDELIRAHILKKNKDISAEKLNGMMASAKAQFNTSDKGLMVRLIVAAIIEEQYGRADRGEYLYEVLTGTAQ